MSRAWKIRTPSGFIRDVQSEDWKFIYQLGRECDLWPRHANDTGVFSLPNMMLPIAFETLVIEGSGGPCGYLAWCIHEHGGRAEIISIAVDPAFRRNGYGTRLLWRVGSQSVARGFHRVVVTVNERDDRSIAFFRAAGMRAIGVFRRLFGDSDGYRFQISLGGTK